MDLFLIDPEDLTFEERMKIKGAWPVSVSIADISLACYPNDTEAKQKLIYTIVELCKSGKLKYYGDIKGWGWGRFLYSDDSYAPTGESENPYPGTIGASISGGDIMQDFISSRDKWRAGPSSCLIHKDEFERYLQSVNTSAIGYLANWWSAAEQQDEAVGDGGAGSDVNKLSKPQIQQESTDTTEPAGIKNATDNKQAEVQKAKVAKQFIQFQELRTNQVSVVIMEDKTVKMVINGKTITVYLIDLGLKQGSQGWNLLEGAAVSSGDLTNVLKKLNTTTDQEKEKNKN